MTADAATLINEFLQQTRNQSLNPDNILNLPAAAALLQAPAEVRAEAVVLALQRLVPPQGLAQKARNLLGGERLDYHAIYGVRTLCSRLLRARLPFSETQLVAAFGALRHLHSMELPRGGLLRALEAHVEQAGLSDELRQVLEPLAQGLETDIYYAEARKALARLQGVLRGSDGQEPRPLVEPGVWGDQVLTELDAMQPKPRQGWDALLAHAALAAGKSKPSKRWQTQVEPLVQAVGQQQLCDRLIGWMQQAKLGWPHRPEWGMPKDAELGMSDRNQDLLKGLIWAAAGLQDGPLAHAIGSFGERCYRKIKDFGPASKRLGNACLFTLAAMPDGVGVSHLSRLASKVRYASGRRQVERALELAAERAGQSREDLEELAVPTFDLDASGQRQIQLGPHSAQLAVEGGNEAVLRWLRPDGKPQKSVPKAVRDNHPQQLKELKQQHKELKDLLGGQAARLQRMWINDRRLPLGQLRQRYLEHPVVGQLARRLLWQVAQPDGGLELMWQDGRLVTLGGQPVTPNDDAEARLWHILDAQDLERVMVWRDYLDQRRLSQPFRQLWREVYRPQDGAAAQDTRFRGHIIRQHIFRNLCQQRGWQYNIQGHWDSYNTPTRPLPQRGLVAALEVEPVDHAKDDYIFNYLVTGALSFHAAEQGVMTDAAVPLRNVPAVVFSEVLRDVDLFVGVSGVANDPDFSPADIKRAYANYWTETAWGELAPVARTRREVLGRVLPRTTLRDCTALQDRWLVVQPPTGHRIHLGSANVQRLTDGTPQPVVPDRKALRHVSQVFLPFEGDSMLGTILAKAFMLAGR